MLKFGEFVKQLRLERRITLRSFCSLTGYDPSNWSKIERNLQPAPRSKEMLERIANVLHIGKDSDEWFTLIDLAVIESIPPSLIEESIVDKLPIFFRTVRGETPTREELEKLIKLIKES